MIVGVSAAQPSTVLALALALHAVGAPWPCWDVRKIVLRNLRRCRCTRISKSSRAFSLLLGFVIRHVVVVPLMDVLGVGVVPRDLLLSFNIISW